MNTLIQSPNPSMIQSLNDSIPQSQNPWKWLALIVVAYLITTAWNLHIQAVTNPDEPRYAVAAREMLRSGNWSVPQFNCEPRVIKPLFFYWLISATGSVGQVLGLTLDTAFRLGPLLMGLLTVIATFLLGRKILGTRGGFLAAILLLSTIYFHDVSRKLIIDMTLTAFVAWSWVLGYEVVRRVEQQRSAGRWLLCFYICLGFTCMVKGPAPVAAFIVFPLFVYLFWSRRLNALKQAGLWWGVPLAIALGFSWSVLLYLQGQEVWKFYETETFGRAIGMKDHLKPIPFVFYFETLVGDFEPWLLILVVIAVWSWRRVRAVASMHEESLSFRSLMLSFSDDARLLTCIIGIAFCCVGLSISKRPMYLLPLYPFFALWIAWGWERGFLKREGSSVSKRWANFIAILIIALGLAGIVALPCLAKFGAQNFECIVGAVISLSLIAGGVTLWRFLSHGRRVAATITVLTLSCLIMFMAESVVRPVRERAHNLKDFYKTVANLRENRPLVLLGLHSSEAVWYLDSPLEKFNDVHQSELQKVFFDAPDALLLVKTKDMSPELERMLHIRARLWRGEEFVLGEAVVRKKK